MAFETNQCETSMHETTWEDINALVVCGCEFDDDCHTSTEKKTIDRGKYNYQPMYTESF